MFDSNHVFLGIAPIGWCNDDMPELGGENTFQQTVSEMALAGFTGCEIGNKYPKDPAELKKALDLRGMRIASRWYSSFLLTRPFEEEEKDFIANLDFLAAVGANRINVSEQSYSIQGTMDVPVLTGGHKHVMDDAEWKLLCDGLNKLGKIAADRGFKLCFHHHMGTVVQTSEETDRMMANTDPRYVFLCYDTGHFTFAGEDPLAMLKKYVDRVGHVHLKDMRLPVVEEARKNDWSFLQAVRNGAFTVPGGVRRHGVCGCAGRFRLSPFEQGQGDAYGQQSRQCADHTDQNGLPLQRCHRLFVRLIFMIHVIFTTYPIVQPFARQARSLSVSSSQLSASSTGPKGSNSSLLP